MWVTKLLLVPTDFDSTKKKKEVSGDQQLFEYTHVSKYLIFWSVQE